MIETLFLQRGSPNKAPKPLKPLVTGLLLASTSACAQAGFLTGFTVGSAFRFRQENTDFATGGVRLLRRDHVRESPKGDACSDVIRDLSSGRFLRHITPEEYAIHAGYRLVHKKAVPLADNRIYIVMEVAKNQRGPAPAIQSVQGRYSRSGEDAVRACYRFMN